MTTHTDKARLIVNQYRQMNECLITNQEFLEGRITKALRETELSTIEKLEKLDPLEATGNFWEYGETDDVAHGVHRWLVKQLRLLSEKEDLDA